jgi:hypothetical protein
MIDWHEREERLRRAVEQISQAATGGKFFKPPRTGARPTERVRDNVFFFVRYGEAPRGWLRGYWLYLEVPEANLPAGVELLPEGQHGRFNARVLLTAPDADAVLAATLAAIKTTATSTDEK